MLVIDDGDDGSVRTGGDKVNDCYVADYDCDGTVDRMVDYIDDDGDGKVDRMEIRYYAGGRLNFCWFSDDLDHDGDHDQPGRLRIRRGRPLRRGSLRGPPLLHEQVQPGAGSLVSAFRMPLRLVRHRRGRVQRDGGAGERGATGLRRQFAARLRQQRLLAEVGEGDGSDRGEQHPLQFRRGPGEFGGVSAALRHGVQPGRFDSVRFSRDAARRMPSAVRRRRRW